MSLTSNARPILNANVVAKPSSSPIFHKQKSTTKREKNNNNNNNNNKAANNQFTSRSCSCRLPVTTKGLSTPIKHLKYVGSKAVGVLKMMSPTPRRRANSSTIVTSERANSGVVVTTFLDTQRAQAINDCIEFINSSSSSSSTTTTLSRSKSVSH